MKSSKPLCFATDNDWYTWLALTMQCSEWNRLRAYPRQRAEALRWMIGEAEHAKKMRVAAGLAHGDIDNKLEGLRIELDDALAQPVKVGTQPLNFCVDCTKCYRDKMVAQGKCERPWTRFVANYSPVTQEVSIEGDSLKQIGRYPRGYDPRSGERRFSMSDLDYPPREQVAL